MEEETDRPNRSTAYPSTWNKWTAEERGIYRGLQREKAQDLAAHLYNCHKLSTINWKKKQAASSQSEAAGSGEEDNPDSFSGFPQAAWTAWPLNPDLVPRVGDNTINISERASQSFRNLRGVLLAQLQKNARLQYAARSQMSRPPAEHSKSHSLLNHDGDLALRNDIATTHIHTSHSSHSMEAIEDDERMPLDDEDIDDIVRPVAHSILSKLDTLLSALCMSRNAYMLRPLQQASDDPSQPSSISVGNEGYKQRRARNWDEVLGAAYIAGWDAAVVDRSVQRCSSLLGETSRSLYAQEADRTSISESSQRLATEFDPDWSLDTLRCPHRDCNRYPNIFSFRYRLVQHIRSVHKWDPNVQRHPPTETRTYDPLLETIARNSRWHRRLTRMEHMPGGDLEFKRRGPGRPLTTIAHIDI